MASRTAKRLKRFLLKNCEHSVHAELQKRHRRRDDPAYDERQDDQRQIMGPIRFVMMNQGHVFLPCEFFDPLGERIVRANGAIGHTNFLSPPKPSF